MSIAYKEYEGIGSRLFAPEGPYGAAGNAPLPSFLPGSVVAGDAESEFTFVTFCPGAAVTLNQGDWLIWDNSYLAVQPVLGATAHPVGASLGTFFLGGRVGDPASQQGNVWSWTFAAGGTYGIWVQRAGTSLSNLTITNANKQVNTSSTPGQLTQITAGVANSLTISGVGAPATSYSLASSVLVSGNFFFTLASATSAAKGLYKGMYLSGTGIPNGSYITDFDGTTVWFTNKAGSPISASGTVTVTAAANTVWGTIVNGQPYITGVPSIPGVYPNQTLSGTGTSGTIKSITGVPGNYTITMSGNAGAGNAFASAITTSNYSETFLRWPYGQTQN